MGGSEPIVAFGAVYLQVFLVFLFALFSTFRLPARCRSVSSLPFPHSPSPLVLLCRHFHPELCWDSLFPSSINLKSFKSKERELQAGLKNFFISGIFRSGQKWFLKSILRPARKIINFGYFCLGNSGIEIRFHQIPENSCANPKKIFQKSIFL